MSSDTARTKENERQKKTQSKKTSVQNDAAALDELGFAREVSGYRGRRQVSIKTGQWVQREENSFPCGSGPEGKNEKHFLHKFCPKSLKKCFESFEP